MLCLCVEVIHCYVQAGFLQFVIMILFETDCCTFLSFFFFLFFFYLWILYHLLLIVTMGGQRWWAIAFFGSPPTLSSIVWQHRICVFGKQILSLSLSFSTGTAAGTRRLEGNGTAWTTKKRFSRSCADFPLRPKCFVFSNILNSNHVHMLHLLYDIICFEE